MTRINEKQQYILYQLSEVSPGTPINDYLSDIFQKFRFYREIGNEATRGDFLQELKSLNKLGLTNLQVNADNTAIKLVADDPLTRKGRQFTTVA